MFINNGAPNIVENTQNSELVCAQLSASEYGAHKQVCLLSNLVVCVLLAAPAWTEVLNGHTQVGASEVEQHLFGFVEQVSTKAPLDLHDTLYRQHTHADR